MYKLWKRTFAFCVDAFLLTGLFVIAVYLLDSLFNMAPVYNLFSFSGGAGQGSLSVSLRGFFEAEKSAFVYLYYLAIILVLFLAYEYFFQHSVLSATPGKYLFRLQVVYQEKTLWSLLIRALLKFLFCITVFGVALEFFIMYFHKKRRTIHDFVAGSEVCPREARNKRVLPKGVGWFFLIAVVTLLPYYFANQLAKQSYTEIKYSETISIDDIGKELYEGIWVNSNRTLTFTYLNNKLYIHDSEYDFSGFQYLPDHTLMCRDRNGDTIILARKSSKQLTVSQITDNTVRYYEYTKQEPEEAQRK
jgi:uncharacterized RDD family membrane protein YckC